ncbi:MAG: efflux RND transporter permease subunit [Balneolaceae bacterium]|nr:efflux RND transporter permease subunit [Balneolaceae bacterium]
MSDNNQQNGLVSSDGQQPVENRKEFGLSSFSIDNRISVLVIIVLVALFGIQSYLAIPKESAPDITIPNIMVITTYPGCLPRIWKA